MTENIEHEEDGLEEEDPRTPLWESIANAIATLSDATDAPTGVSAASVSIGSDDVDMTSDSWMPQLAQIQDWLNLGLAQRLPDAGRDAFLAVLISGLELDSAEALDTSVTPSQLTLLALERLSQRLEFAVRLQKAFAEEMESDGVTRASATTNWTNAW